MFTFVATLHIIVAFSVIFLVLVQDAKDGASGGMFGGGGSSSILGATGATTLMVKLTRIVAVIFAVTCITLWAMVAHKNKSVVDSGVSLPVHPASPETGEVPTAAPKAGNQGAPSAANAGPAEGAPGAAPAAPTTSK